MKAASVLTGQRVNPWVKGITAHAKLDSRACSARQILMTVQAAHASLGEHARMKSMIFPVCVKGTLQASAVRNI